MREIASLLIDIHGQKDNHRLLDPESHISYIDEFGSLQGYLQKYRVLYEEILDVKHRLEQINRKDRERSIWSTCLPIRFGKSNRHS